MRCNCENESCEVLHAAGGCLMVATVGCMYVGGICEDCAEYMPAEFLTGEAVR